MCFGHTGLSASSSFLFLCAILVFTHSVFAVSVFSVQCLSTAWMIHCSRASIVCTHSFILLLTFTTKLFLFRYIGKWWKLWTTELVNSLKLSTVLRHYATLEKWPPVTQRLRSEVSNEYSSVYCLRTNVLVYWKFEMYFNSKHLIYIPQFVIWYTMHIHNIIIYCWTHLVA